MPDHNAASHLNFSEDHNATASFKRLQMYATTEDQLIAQLYQMHPST
jgi:hypothetical protein